MKYKFPAPGNMFSKISRIHFMLVTVVLLPFLPGCLPRLVPIQTARIIQMDFYRQWYDFNNDQQLADSTLSAIVGTRNWEVVTRHYGRKEVIQDLLNGDIEVRGAFSLTISLSPTVQDSFFVDGIGRYFLVNNKTDEIMQTGDFHVKNQRYALQDIEKGTLRVSIKQFTLRYFAPQDKNYYHDTSIDFIIHLETISKKRRIYNVEYSGRHEVVFGDKVIGYLEFDDKTPRYDKLIDLRGLSLVKNDYRKILSDYLKKQEKHTSYTAKNR